MPAAIDVAELAMLSADHFRLEPDGCIRWGIRIGDGNILTVRISADSDDG
jgi:hypothetical protein